MRAINLEPELLLQIISGLGGRPNPDDTGGGPQQPPWWHGPPGPWIAASTQDPEPVRAFADLLSSAVVLQAMTAFITDGPLREKMSTAATGFIGRFTDDYCGTPPGKRGPFPRGHLMLIEKAAEMYALASAMRDGELKSRMIATAAQFAEAGVSALSKADMSERGAKVG